MDVPVCHPPAWGEVGWPPRPPDDCRLGWAIYNLEGSLHVSNYAIEELIARWRREELTVEQMIGQILLLLKEQERRLREATLPSHEHRER